MFLLFTFLSLPAAALLSHLCQGQRWRQCVGDTIQPKGFILCGYAEVHSRRSIAATMLRLRSE